MTNNYEHYPQVCADTNQLNKTAVFDALSAAGITEVTVTFNGYGDDGQIQDINAYLGETPAELPKCLVTVQEPSHRDHNQAVDQTLPEAIEALCYDYLSDLHEGWEIDDGSFGDFTFDVAARTIHLEYNGRICSVFTESEEL
jgi:hypothetical protein